MQERMRLRFLFWLNVKQDDEWELAQTIDRLKESRSFTDTLRLGIRIVTELQQGKIDTLLKEFPWVEDCFTRVVTETVEVPIGLPVDFSPLEHKLNSLSLQIKQIQSVSVSVPADGFSAKPTSMNLGAPKNNDNLLDDTDIKQATARDDVNPGANMRIQAAGLMGNAWHILTQADFDYGVRVGKVPADAPRKKSSAPPKPAAKPGKPAKSKGTGNADQITVTESPATPEIGKPGGLKAIAGADATFEAPPDLDDLDFEL